MPKHNFHIYFQEEVGKPLKQNISLCAYSNFGIGGRADYFFEASSLHELKSSVVTARECGIPYYLIGGGYNLLFDDEGFRGLIIRNMAGGVKDCGKEVLEAYSGTSLNRILKFAQEKGLSGLEFLAGIPGTLGGAVFGNAGAFGQSIGNWIKEAVILEENSRETRVSREYFGFAYRQSQLKEKHDILLKLVFVLQKEDRKKIQDAIEEKLRLREEKHPPEGTSCAGSYFKNPVLPDGTRESAGRLLEQVDAKNIRVGQAAVFAGHANFIINQGGASARDVLRLAEELKKRVKDKFGIELEEEVIFVPANASMP